MIKCHHSFPKYSVLRREFIIILMLRENRRLYSRLFDWMRRSVYVVGLDDSDNWQTCRHGGYSEKSPAFRLWKSGNPSFRGNCVRIAENKLLYISRKLLPRTIVINEVPISCHFRDCRPLLVESLAHVSSAIASTRTFAFYVCADVTVISWRVGVIQAYGSHKRNSRRRALSLR